MNDLDTSGKLEFFSNVFILIIETKCQSFHDYASECRDQGVVVDWREDAEVKSYCLFLENMKKSTFSCYFIR